MSSNMSPAVPKAIYNGWEVIPFKFQTLEFPVKIDVYHVKTWIKYYNDINVHGDRNQPFRITELIASLQNVALNKEDKTWKVSAAARREARKWLMVQGTYHLDMVKTWFE